MTKHEYPPPPIPNLITVGIVNDEYPYRHPQLRDALGRYLIAHPFTIGKRQPTLRRPPLIFLQCKDKASTFTATWNTMTPAQRYSWKPFAKRWRIQLFFAYMKYNFDRHVEGLPPVITP